MRKEARGISIVEKKHGPKRREKGGTARTGHAELLFWSRRGLRSAREMRAKGYSPPNNVRFAFSSSKGLDLWISHPRYFVATRLEHAEILIKA